MKQHITVVGAGFAGMAAAYELNSLGYAVTVLEARQRVSGRVWSKKLANGTTVELGAEWIGPGDHTVRDMAKRLNIPLANVGVDFLAREAMQGAAVSSEMQHETIRVAAQEIAAMDKTVIAKSTVDEFINNLPVSNDQKLLFSSRLQCSFGTHLSNIALRMLSDRSSTLRKYDAGVQGDTLYHRVVGGNHKIAIEIAARLQADDSADVHLGYKVTSIAHNETGVIIKGLADQESFEIKADAVIVAVPVKLLSELEFNPALPAEQADAFAKVPMGIAAKIAVGTKQPPPLRGLQDVKMPYWCWTGKGGDGSVRKAVTAFCGSTQAQENLATNSNDPTTWLRELQSANPDLDFEDEPILVDWSQDDLARGCYSAFDNPAADTIPFLSKPVGRLFFAGEHTAVASGTMEGAMASGLRASKDVVEVITL